jgi:hypothetical protein
MPKIPTVLLTSTRPTSDAAHLNFACSKLLTAVVTSRKLPKKLLTPPRTGGGTAVL